MKSPLCNSWVLHGPEIDLVGWRHWRAGCKPSRRPMEDEPSGRAFPAMPTRQVKRCTHCTWLAECQRRMGLISEAYRVFCRVNSRMAPGT